MASLRPAPSRGDPMTAESQQTTRKPSTPRRSRRLTAGKRLIAEMSSEGDSFSVRMLIDQAAHTADLIENLRKLTSGDLATWTTLKLGPQVVQVVIDSPIREMRQLGSELRHLLAEIHRQRADIPIGDDDDDVLAGLD
jgi:hypothetical protein